MGHKVSDETSAAEGAGAFTEFPPVIYLDQCHWVTMARARVSRAKVSDAEELAAADALWQAVEQGAVRLPLSSAHMLETAHAGATPRRRDLARAMLDGYAGWFMRHPVDVRRLELIWGLRARQGAKPASADVFSREPATPFRASEYTPYVCDADDLSDPQRRMVEYLAAKRAWESVLIEDSLTAEELAAASAVVNSWARKHEKLAHFMRDNPTGRDKRLVAALMTIEDLTIETAEAAVIAGVSVSEMEVLITPTSTVEFFAALPFIGRVQEITYQRLRNSQYKWHANDLNDLMFLACAAAYADIVVAEKDTAGALQSGASRTTDGALVLRKIKEIDPSWLTDHS